MPDWMRSVMDLGIGNAPPSPVHKHVRATNVVAAIMLCSLVPWMPVQLFFGFRWLPLTNALAAGGMLAVLWLNQKRRYRDAALLELAVMLSGVGASLVLASGQTLRVREARRTRARSERVTGHLGALGLFARPVYATLANLPPRYPEPEQQA